MYSNVCACILHAAGLMNNSYEDFIAGHGELWSARLVGAKCKQMGFPVEVMDTRDVVVSSLAALSTSRMHVRMHQPLGIAQAARY